VPEAVPLGRHLGEAAPADDALGARGHDVEVHRAAGVLVLVLQQQPRLRVVPLDLDEGPAAVELLAVQLELQLALLQGLRGVEHGRPRPAVPEHDGARAVLALRDHVLERAVVEGVVLDVHREALVVRVEGRALRHGPAQQHAVKLQAEVVVQARRRVLLDAVGEPAARADLARRLRRAREVALLPVVLEGHAEG